MDARDGLRTTLISAALSFLEAEGAEPSLRAVARAAGVSAMAPYRHFADKAALLAAVADHGFAKLHGDLVAADRQPGAREALIAQGLAFVGFSRENPALFQLMYGPQYGGASPKAIAGAYDVLAKRVAGLLPAQSAAATLACRALLQGLAMIDLNGRMAPGEPDDVATAITLLVDGFVARSA